MQLQTPVSKVKKFITNVNPKSYKSTTPKGVWGKVHNYERKVHFYQQM